MLVGILLDSSMQVSVQIMLVTTLLQGKKGRGFKFLARRRTHAHPPRNPRHTGVYRPYRTSPIYDDTAFVSDFFRVFSGSDQLSRMTVSFVLNLLLVES